MPLKMPVVELERRLSTERVLDIFTMQPKVGYCHLFKRQAPHST